MITYHPPKSQWWGHQVSRLSAIQVVDRGLHFLQQKTKISNRSTTPELTVHWSSVRASALPTSMATLKNALGLPTKEMDFPSPIGPNSRQYRWTVPTEQLRPVAEWFDAIFPLMEDKEVFAQCIALWNFDWVDADESIPEHRRSINMFGVQLCRPHRVCTYFSFPMVDRYYEVKAFLAEIGLVTLSDRNIRPKGSVPSAVQRSR